MVFKSIQAKFQNKGTMMSDDDNEHQSSSTTTSTKNKGKSNTATNNDSKPKLVWAIFEPDIWWPALLYPSLEDFESNICPQLKDRGDYSCYQEVCKHLAAIKHFNKGTTLETVVYLGRSIHDFRLVRDRKNTIQRFGGDKMERMKKNVICQPQAFVTMINRKKEYFAFHNGLDEAMRLIAKKASTSNTNNSSDNHSMYVHSINWRERAEQAWKEQQQQQQKQQEYFPTTAAATTTFTKSSGATSSTVSSSSSSSSSSSTSHHAEKKAPISSCSFNKNKSSDVRFRPLYDGAALAA